MKIGCCFGALKIRYILKKDTFGLLNFYITLIHERTLT